MEKKNRKRNEKEKTKRKGQDRKEKSEHNWLRQVQTRIDRIIEDKSRLVQYLFGTFHHAVKQLC